MPRIFISDKLGVGGVDLIKSAGGAAGVCVKDLTTKTQRHREEN